jgi:flagellar protein FliT
MGTEPYPLQYYELIKRTTGEMLVAAQRGDWEELLRKEAVCSEIIEQLKEHTRVNPLRTEERDKKTAVLRRVLADDAEIRNILSPWLQRVGALLQNNSQAEKIHRAYKSTRG